MKTRILEPEDMDDPALDPAAHRLALMGLARLNRISFTAISIWHVLERQYLADRAKQKGSESWSVIDIATGGGDLPVWLAKKAKLKGYNWQVAGADRSPVALECAAQKAAAADVEVEWLELDATRDSLPPCDWIISSLFFHHLDDSTLVELLKRMAQAARQGILIDDLERTVLNRALVFIGAHLLSTSDIVHKDSDRSVRAAFTLSEMAVLAKSAELQRVQISSRFPARFQLLWQR
jgi:2-polyprenyl-3-methyl-5-hydroxy-6-metoxy-1,4-benzoquinol methylase